MGDIIVEVKKVGTKDTIFISGNEYKPKYDEIVIDPWNIMGALKFSLITPGYVFPSDPIGLRDTPPPLGSCNEMPGEWDWSTPIKDRKDLFFTINFFPQIFPPKVREAWFALKVLKKGTIGPPIVLDPKIRNGQPTILLTLAIGLVVLAVIAVGVGMLFGKP